MRLEVSLMRWCALFFFCLDGKFICQFWYLKLFQQRRAHEGGQPQLNHFLLFLCHPYTVDLKFYTAMLKWLFFVM